MDAAVEPRSRLPRVTRPRIRIGEILLNMGALSEADLQKVLAAHLDRGEPFGKVAVGMKLITEGELRSALAQQFTYPIARIEIDNLESRWHRWPMAVGRRQPVGEPTPDESSLAAEVARLRRVIDAQTFHYTDAVVAREDSLRAMTESHSWRVTAPLRWATTSLRLLRGRIRR